MSLWFVIFAKLLLVGLYVVGSFVCSDQQFLFFFCCRNEKKLHTFDFCGLNHYLSLICIKIWLFGCKILVFPIFCDNFFVFFSFWVVFVAALFELPLIKIFVNFCIIWLKNLSSMHEKAQKLLILIILIFKVFLRCKIFRFLYV